MRTSVIILLFVFLNSCNSVSGNSMKIDEYVDMTLEQIIEDLGIPDYRSEQFIDSRYLPTPIEPIYAAYFSQSALEQGVTITVARWVLKKDNTNIVVWLKESDKKWIAFSSLRYQKKVNIQVG